MLVNIGEIDYRTGVNVINILRAAFTCVVSESTKRQSSCQSFLIFQDLWAQKLLIKCWWNWPRISLFYQVRQSAIDEWQEVNDERCDGRTDLWTGIRYTNLNAIVPKSWTIFHKWKQLRKVVKWSSFLVHSTLKISWWNPDHASRIPNVAFRTDVGKTSLERSPIPRKLMLKQ